jgi:hypothetical protein
MNKRSLVLVNFEVREEFVVDALGRLRGLNRIQKCFEVLRRDEVRIREWHWWLGPMLNLAQRHRRRQRRKLLVTVTIGHLVAVIQAQLEGALRPPVQRRLPCRFREPVAERSDHLELIAHGGASQANFR